MLNIEMQPKITDIINKYVLKDRFSRHLPYKWGNVSTNLADRWKERGPIVAAPDQRAELLDELDRKIVAALQVNVRASWPQIARAIGSSESTVARRANRLLDEGLLKFLVAPEASNAHDSESVLLAVKCDPGTVRTVAQFFAERPAVRFAAIVTGTFDLLVEHEIESHQLTKLLLDELYQIPGVRETSSHSVTKTFKKANEWARHLLGDAASSLKLQTPRGGPLHLMDEIDLALIKQLREDARQSSAELATALSVSAPVARRRLDTLIASKSISLGMYIEPRRLGFGVEAVIWLDSDFGSMARIADRLNTLTEVRYLAAIAGTNNLICEVILPNMNALFEFQSTILAGFETLRGVTINIELQTIKRSFVQIATL